MDIVKSLETLIQKLKQSDTSNHGKIIKNIKELQQQTTKIQLTSQKTIRE